jgi:hypothetical protein
MTRSTVTRFAAVTSVAVLTHLPSTASACAACMGNPNSKTAGAINDAIFLLLGCIGLVLGLLAAFAIYLMKRAGGPPAAHS